MKKIKFILVPFLIITLFTSCDFESPPQTYIESKPQSIWRTEEVDAVVTNVWRNQWFAGCAHRDIEVGVYVEKYNLTEWVEEHYDGMMVDEIWELNEDDKVKVEVEYLINENKEIINKPNVRFITKVET